jgi:hypothetical protein
MLKEKRKVQNVFLDIEAEVSGDDDDDDDNEDDEGSGGDEDELVEDVTCGEPQRTDAREKSTFREVEADLSGDGSQAGETLPAAEQGIPNDTFKGIIGTMVST